MTTNAKLSDARKYIAPQVCSAARINPTTLRTWRSRGFISIEKDHEREWTKFSETDALMICVLADLVRTGVELKIAAQIARGFQSGDLLNDDFAIVFDIGVNIDKPRVPAGAGYSVLAGPSETPVLKDVLKRQKEGTTRVHIDLKAIRVAMRAALEAL